ncbi:lysophospholipid acyltransferase family protein, partial [Myxococcota bacterium]|nr:lysophospholipid acyltransferase family protein [Myxococcota bacterium]
MIAPRYSPALSWIFGLEARRRLRAMFGRVYVHGLSACEATLRRQPVLLISNHVSLYDALLAMHLARRWGPAARCMMDADNLRARPFLGRIGAFGVARGGEGDVEALRYAADHLRAPEHLVWIFPQGVERPEELRPLGFHRGAAVVSEAAREAAVIPLALRYAFGSGPRPEAWLSFGPPIPAVEGIEARRDAQERAVEAELARIQAAIAADRLRHAARGS